MKDILSARDKFNRWLESTEVRTNLSMSNDDMFLLFCAGYRQRIAEEKDGKSE